MIALILGGAQSVWADLERAERLVVGQPHLVVACNFAGIDYAGHLDAWVTHHPDHFAAWRSKRVGNTDYRSFVAAAHPSVPDAQRVDVAWDGSSGLYAAQIALVELGASGAVLCGVPMEAEAGHIFHPGPWSPPGPYRAGFREALPEIGGRLRSMGGWTRAVFGEPTSEWLAQISMTSPMRPFRPQTGEPQMYRVRNEGAATLTFNGRDEKGVLQTFRIAPGATSDPVDVHPGAADFVQHDGAVVTPYKPAPARSSSPKPAAKKASGKSKAAKAAPAAPAAPDDQTEA